VQLSEILADGKPIATVSFENFIDRLICYLQHNDDCDLIGRFLLRMGWQSNEKKGHFIISNGITILQSRTESILKMINFQWSVINDSHLKTYVEKLAYAFDEVLAQRRTTPQYFGLKQGSENIVNVINAAKTKAVRLFKAHKKAFSIAGILLLIGPLLYILDILDMITVSGFLDESV
jgi:hypothetical protein